MNKYDLKVYKFGYNHTVLTHFDIKHIYKWFKHLIVRQYRLTYLILYFT